MSEIRQVLNFNEKLAIYKFLGDEAVLKKPEDSDLWEYQNNWDDERVAKKFTADLGRPVTKAHVRNIRLEQFGEVRAVVLNGGISNARLTTLEEKVATLEKALVGKGDAISVLQRQVKVLVERVEALCRDVGTLEERLPKPPMAATAIRTTTPKSLLAR